MRDNDPSAYDGTAQDLQREASGVTAGDLPLLFAAIVIGGVVGLFNRLRRHKPEQPQAEPQPAAPAPASSHAPSPVSSHAPATTHPVEYLHPHGC